MASDKSQEHENQGVRLFALNVSFLGWEDKQAEAEVVPSSS